MSTHIGIGFSDHRHAAQAAREAALQSLQQSGSSRPQLVLILSTFHYSPHETLPAVHEVLHPLNTIGSSTTGILLSNKIVTKGLAILSIASDEIHFGASSIPNVPHQDRQETGALLAKECLADFGQHKRSAFIFFMDSHLSDNSLLLKGLQGVLGNVFPIIGAGSSVNFQTTGTFYIFNQSVITHSVSTGFLMGGPIQVGVGTRHGWRPLGKPRVITKASGNIIHTINDQKAIHLYEEYFEDEANNLKTNAFNQMKILYPLGIFMENSPEYLLQNAIDVLPDGSIVCQGQIPVDTEVHIMIGNKDSCQQSVVLAAKEAKQNLLGRTPRLIMIFESIARLKLLGRMAVQEIYRVKEIFGDDIPIIGMYTHGEIAPLQSIGNIKKPHLQNGSIIVVAIG